MTSGYPPRPKKPHFFATTTGIVLLFFLGFCLVVCLLGALPD